MNQVNWKDLPAVIAYAKSLKAQRDQVVFKHPERENFNITSKERTDRYQPSWVKAVIPASTN